MNIYILGVDLIYNCVYNVIVTKNKKVKILYQNYYKNKVKKILFLLLVFYMKNIAYIVLKK